MELPFRLLGNQIQVYRYQAVYHKPTFDEEGNKTQIEVEEPFVTEGEAIATGGVVTALDVSDVLWLDGIVLGQSTNPMIEAVAIYQAGKDAWRNKLTEEKCGELSAACHAAIVAGCDVQLEDGSVRHFSLDETDQINLTTALATIERGVAGYPYHADGQICRLFSAADIYAIANAATAHKLYHTTLCNHLLAWARRAETDEELASITYGAQLPEDLAANMNEVLTNAMAL